MRHLRAPEALPRLMGAGRRNVAMGQSAIRSMISASCSRLAPWP